MAKTSAFQAVDWEFDSPRRLMEHKTYTLPEINLSHDEGDPRYLAEGPTTPVLNDKGEVYAYRWNGLHPGHYAEYYRLCIVEEWERIVTEYESNPDSSFHAWYYIDNHPMFWEFHPHKGFPVNHVSVLLHNGAWSRGWPEITPHMVCPATNIIEDDDELNTRLEWWYEFGRNALFPDKDGVQIPTHDCEMDGGASTYEEAVVAIAGKIHEHYGNDRVIADAVQ
jgi:hypothetical protein